MVNKKSFSTLFSGRYSILLAFYILFISISFIVRLILLCMSFSQAHLTFIQTITIFLKGFVFDTGVAAFFSILYSLYLLILPQKLNNTLFNKILTCVGFFITSLILMFSFFAEFTFWIEFESRFNFIAVDYLVYTYEVINNINQSYPLPLLIGGMLFLAALITFLFFKLKIFKCSFQSSTPLATRIAMTITIFVVVALFAFKINNSWAESSNNRYYNELSKAGIYSFFAAFKNNELDYNHFYALEDENEAFNILRNCLAEDNSHYLKPGNDIYRQVTNDSLHADSSAIRPNVIMITVESLSADFMQRFGNKENITPVLDSLAKKSILFTNLYATGTRTVRGMEALMLAVPPSPGNSIVRRPGNEHLFSVGSVFRKKGYECSFFYGGDGYFDNMNQFFGTNGFDIIDRGRKGLIGDNITTKRTIIPDNAVHFENAWGMCDEDIYNAAIREADNKHKEGKPFFDFIMTTSNHRPFTYPEGRIDLPQGGRDGAVKYTDYAIGEFIKKAQSKPWFSNTIFIIVADHCASSAGKDEIDIAHYHIPCIIYNLPNTPPAEIDKLCSQIDLYPTLLSYLGWNYPSNWYGQNVLLPGYEPRCFVGTYQTLGYLQGDTLVQLRPQQQVDCFIWDKDNNTQKSIPKSQSLSQKAIAYYQTAYYLFKNGGMKERK